MSKSCASLMFRLGGRKKAYGILYESSKWCFPINLANSRHSILILSQFSTDEESKSNNTSTKVPANSNKDHSRDSSNTSLKNDIETKPFFTQDPAFGNVENKGLGAGNRPYFNPEDTEENIIVDYELQPPTNCCMSGCPNCVWLEYVEKLTTIYSNPDLTKEKILKELGNLEDQNIKAFIMMELRTRKLL